MANETASISLLDHITETGFRSSVISTYNCYFPFYEDVVLRRLMAAGCTHNVLMVDAARCAEAFARNELRPQRAGRDYTLIPVKVGGAFHPKIFLRLGKSKGSLLVGSHNATLSGFGMNDELTNLFRIDGASVRSGGGLMRQAFEYLAQFVPAELPEVHEAYEAMKLGIPWMEGPLAAGDPARLLLTSAGADRDLWSQVVPLVPPKVKTAFICGPFFDPALALVRRIQREIRPKELVIGIDPSSAEIDPSQAASLESVRWVNVAGVAPVPRRREGSFHYMHAKILWFAGDEKELLVAGSANPSVAAFFAPEAVRNAEAVIADSRTGAGIELGIDALIGAPAVTVADWTAVAARRASKPDSGCEPKRRVFVATPMATGFRTNEAMEIGLILCGIGSENTPLGEAVVREPALLDAPELVRDEARFLEGHADGEHLFALVHRPEDIAKNIGGDTRKALRQAIGALEEDPSQLEALLKLTEKVIFDSDDVVRARPLRAPVESKEGQDLATAPTSLALDAAGRRKSQRKRSLASGDIVVLLDALIRRLGEGLPYAAPRPRSDQDEIDVDEEDGGELAREVPNFELLAKACRGKIRRLIKRMQGQLELSTAPDQARRGIVQLAAVLGVVRTLRVVGQRPEWRRAQTELVDPDDQMRLFERALLAVVWGDDALAPRAIAEAGGEWFDELSMVTGLLAWMAWDVRVDIEEASRREGFQGVEDESWYSLQLLAALGPWLADDDGAVTTLEESVKRTPRRGVDADRWLRIHRAILNGYASVTANPDRHGKVGRPTRPGDLIVLGGSESPRVRVVLDVRPGSPEPKVVFFEPGHSKKERTFQASRVRTLTWARAPAFRQVSA